VAHKGHGDPFLLFSWDVKISTFPQLGLVCIWPVQDFLLESSGFSVNSTVIFRELKMFFENAGLQKNSAFRLTKILFFSERCFLRKLRFALEN